MTLCQLQCKRYLSATHLGEMCLNWLLKISFTVRIYILNFHARKRMKNYMSDDKTWIAEKSETQATLLQAIVMILESQARI
jgi:hypothetical protein